MLLTTCGFAIKLNLQLKTERFLSGADFVSAPYFFCPDAGNLDPFFQIHLNSPLRIILYFLGILMEFHL